MNISLNVQQHKIATITPGKEMSTKNSVKYQGRFYIKNVKKYKKSKHLSPFCSECCSNVVLYVNVKFTIWSYVTMF